jgi:Ca-activated chloride channel homolog
VSKQLQDKKFTAFKNKFVRKKFMKKFSILVIVLLFSCLCVSAQEITQGSLYAVDKKGAELGEVPLKNTKVTADISGFLARVKVVQEFENNSNQPIEAVYTFPLPNNAAVDNMTMNIGGRIIRGKIMKRDDARKVYETARNEGKTASLLDQERPNIFTQSVANIMPMEKITIEISYVETLKYEDGSYEFVFPMTVGPRYIPGNATGKNGGGFAADTNRVPDASKITPMPAKGRAGHDISIEVNLNAGVPVQEIRSSSHQITQENFTPNSANVNLMSEKTIPNKDFILRYDITGGKMEDAVLTHRDEKGGFFTMMLSPPERMTAENTAPKEIVFVLDTSGSMSGFPIEKAKESMKMALDGLYPNDRFNLITFAGDTHVLFDKPVPATKLNLAKAQAFLDTRQGGGGTEMMKAIQTALTPSDSQEHLRIVCFMTDGYIGNEGEILAEIQKHQNARIFSFGIGSSVNRFLLDKMSEEGLGEVEYVSLTDDGSKAAKRFHERIRNPYLTDISIDWNGIEVADVYPAKRIPDLYGAKPVVIYGRYKDAQNGTIKLKGKVGGQIYERNIQVNFPENEKSNDVLATLWARTRIDDLMSKDYNGVMQKDGGEIQKTITNIGLEYSLMTQFTSFVAVEEKVVNRNGSPVKVEVPVEMPEGVSREGIFGDDETDVADRKDSFVKPRKKRPNTAYSINKNKSAGGGSGGMAAKAESKVSTVTTTSESPAPPPKPPRLSATPVPKTISGGVVSGKAINLPQPAYPAAARTAGAKGAVNVQVTIDESGNVISANAVSGNPILRAAAEASARNSKFAPTQISGQPVKVKGIIVYNFVGNGSTVNVENTSPDESSENLNLTPEQIRLAEKLHVWLYDLVERLSKNSAAGENESKFVFDGKAEITIELRSNDAAIIEKLRQTGLEIIGKSKDDVIIGRISIEQLAGLTEIEEVRYILPDLKE